MYLKNYKILGSHNRDLKDGEEERERERQRGRKMVDLDAKLFFQKGKAGGKNSLH